MKLKAKALIKDGFRRLLDYMTAFLLFGAIIAICIIVIPNSDKESNLSKHVISLNFKEFKGIDSLSLSISRNDIDSLKSFSQEIERKLETLETLRLDIIKMRNEESYYTKVYTSLLVIIISIAGFFGFKSMVDIRTRSIELAEEIADKTSRKTAKRTSESEVKKIMTKEYVKSTYDESLHNVRGLFEEDIQAVSDDNLKLETRLSKIEATLEIKVEDDEKLKPKMSNKPKDATVKGDDPFPIEND
jgi:hypothetical protein